MQVVADGDARFAAWLERETGISGARIAGALAGGNANVTRLVETDDGPLVLRHPPVDTISELAGAGIAREFRFISAMAGKAPVAGPVRLCTDPDVLGVPFSLTRFVDGVAITDTMPPAYPDTVATRDAIGHALIDALASVHMIAPDAALLGDVEKAQSFVVRQIRRWRALRGEQAVRDLPLIDSIGAWLEANVPDAETVRIVHCDYHLDNVLVDRAVPEVRAILDWEMATLADPMVDVGLVTAMWKRDERQPLGFGFVQRVSNAAGVTSGEMLAERWASATGLSIAHLKYFQAFALWRLAAIVEGAYVLLRQGKVDGAYERGLEQDVPALLDAARRIAVVEGMT